MKTFTPILLITLLISGCGNEDKNAQNELLQKVMDVHDEIMPKMGDIMKYKKQLNAKISELTETAAEENDAQIETLKEAVEDLENSHEEMMNWMHGFDRNFEGEVQEEVMAYLKDQMTKIESVGNTTNTALKNARELLTE